MKKEPKYIGFCSSKGGVGKTSISVIVASYLHYFKRLSVVVVDCDFPLRNVFRMRERETKVLQQSRFYQQLMSKQYQKTGQKIYPVVPSSPAEAFNDLNKYVSNGGLQPDIVIFDLPGTTNTPGVLTTISCLDQVFIPIKPEPMTMESTLLLVSILTESIIGHNEHNLKGAYLFWTFIDGRESTFFYDRYNEIIREFGLNSLKTRIYDRKGYDREISSDERPPTRSTLFAPNTKFVRDNDFGAFADELIAIINTENDGEEEQ